jgi:elongation factor Tu
MVQIREVRARVYFLRPDEGGRRSIIFTGYRPGIWWDGLEERGGNDGQITLEGKDRWLPGEEGALRIQFYHPDLLPDSVVVGTTFTAREGGRIIGRGEVIEIL